jgi:hypothetical protein
MMIGSSMLLFLLISVPYYQPPTAGPGHTEPSLPPYGDLAIGYGQSGLWGWNYFIDDTQDKELTYLKVFFSTQPVDLSFLVQDSIFDINHARGSRTTLLSQDALIWWTVTVPMVLQRAI